MKLELDAIQSVYRGPSTDIVAAVFVLLFTASLIITNVFTSGDFPTAFFPPEYVHGFYQQFSGILRINAMLQFASAIPLGIFTASITSKLEFHGAKVAGVKIALYGGFASSVFLAVSGLTSWVLAQPGVTNNMDVLHSLQLFSFIIGGVAHVVVLGLLVAGVSIPSMFMKLIPKWLAWAGVIIAVLCELSTISMVYPVAFMFIPLGRFMAFIWMIGAGFSMPSKLRTSIKQSN
jgi:hypothetical protein